MRSFSRVVSRRAPCAARPAWSRPSAWPTSTRASRSGVSSPAALNARASARRTAAIEAGWRSGALMRVTVLGGEQCGLMLGYQRIDDVAERFAFHYLRQLVQRQV